MTERSAAPEAREATADAPGRHGRSQWAPLHELLDADAVTERLLRELLALVPAAEAASIGLSERNGRVVFVHTSRRLAAFVGVSVRTDASLSGHAMATGTVQCCNDVTCDPRVDRSVMERIGMRSMVVVPLVRDGVAFGVVHVLASRAFAFSEEEVATCCALAGVIPALITASAELSRIAELLGTGRAEREGENGRGDALEHFVASVLRPAATARLEARRRVLETLDTRSFRIVFQPIIELGTGAIIALEALSRFASTSPEQAFAEAASVGLGTQLELAALEVALDALDELPHPIGLALNVGPEALESGELVELLADGRGRRVALELTEHAPVRDYDALEVALARLRATGARLSVDDAGAGFASLSHIVRLRPEFVKLDRWMIEGVAGDPVRRSLIAALVGFAHDLGSKVVGEGIETCEEHEVLCEFGVDYGQGYLLGRPGNLVEHLRRRRPGRAVPLGALAASSSAPAGQRAPVPGRAR